MRKTYRLTSLFLAVVCLFAFSLFQPVYGLTELSRENRRFAAEAAAKRAKVYLLKEFGSGAAESIGMGFLSWFTNKRIKFIVKNMGLPSLPGGEQ